LLENAVLHLMLILILSKGPVLTPNIVQFSFLWPTTS